MTICESRSVSIKTTVKAIEERKADPWTITTILTENDADGRIYYSIAVALSPCVHPEEDVCIVHDITGEEAFARQLFTQIADGCVTPCTLEDVLSDLL